MKRLSQVPIEEIVGKSVIHESVVGLERKFPLSGIVKDVSGGTAYVIWYAGYAGGEYNLEELVLCH